MKKILVVLLLCLVAGMARADQYPIGEVHGVIAASFDSGLWVYRSDNTWVCLTGSVPEQMIYINQVIYADFGDMGLWKWFNGWTQISPYNPESMVMVVGAIFVDFGVHGLWKWNGVTLTQITDQSPTLIEGAK